MKKIGFIGTGVMGSAIINNLLQAEYQVNVFNRTKSHAQKVIDHGAIWYDSPALVAQKSDVVFSMVGFPADVQNIYFEEDGIFAGLDKNKIAIDMTTSSPSLAIKLSNHAHLKDIQMLDAPVSGGDIGAINGNLTIMVGGDKQAYQELMPIFKIIGKSANYFGTAGKGQHTKLANQIMIAGTMTGLTEMLLYAEKAGLDKPKVLKTLSQGGAQNWSMDNYVPRILKEDYTPGFFAKHFLKDLRLALQEADKLGIDLRATQEAKRLYEIMLDVKSLGNLGTQGLIKIYTK